MLKKLKITSIILATSLIITPISGMFNQYDNIASATNIDTNTNININTDTDTNTNINNNKKIKRVDKLSPEQTKLVIDKLYQQKLITPDKYKELQPTLELKSFWGSVYVVTFWDNAKDIHIPGWLFSSMAVFSAIAVAKVIAEVAIAYPAVAAIMGRPTARGISWMGGIAVSNFTWNAMKNGLVLYYRPVYYNNRLYTHKFSHMRIDY